MEHSGESNDVSRVHWTLTGNQVGVAWGHACSHVDQLRRREHVSATELCRVICRPGPHARNLGLH